MRGAGARRTAVVISGEGAYRDPWHAYDVTSARLAAILDEQGITVSIRPDVDDALATLDADLLVVNAGDAGSAAAALPTAGAAAGLLRHLASGKPLLAVHSSASAFAGLDEWEDIVGARWVDKTMHPDFGPADIVVHANRHVIVDGATDFTLNDERYSFLRLADDIVPLATHSHDGIEHPLLWAREWRSARVVYDALGHDEQSYDSPEHAALIARSVQWLLGDLDLP